MTSCSVVLVVGESRGGIAAHVAMLSAGLADRYEVTVVAPPGTLARTDLTALAGRVRLVPALGRTGGGEVRQVLRAAGVVHAHGFHAGLQGLLAVRAGARRRLLVSWHNRPPDAPAGARVAGTAVAGLLARSSRVTLGASDDLVGLARRLGSPDARLLPVPAPALAVPSAGEVAAIRRRLDLPADRPVAVAVGRLAPQKDHRTLLSAWARLGVAAPLLVVGDGPLRPELERLAGELGVDARFLGARDDVGDLLAVSAVAVNSSTWEARALVAQEALRAGVPFVGTDVGGVPGLVGEASVLVPPRDPDALAAAVRRVLTDAGLAARLRVAGPRQAATWPGPADLLASIEALYREVMAP